MAIRVIESLMEYTNPHTLPPTCKGFWKVVFNRHII
jgi:hypothetical protein